MKALIEQQRKYFHQHTIIIVFPVLNRCSKESLAIIYFGCTSFEDEFFLCINGPETAQIF
jgi:hypothetical protein